MAFSDPVSLIEIQSIREEGLGTLSVVEFSKNIPFAVKRAFYIYDVPENIIRGEHAHRNASHFMICLSGKVEFNAINNGQEFNYILSDPNHGVYFTPLTWISYKVIEQPFIAIVFSSEYYEDVEYITDIKKLNS